MNETWLRDLKVLTTHPVGLLTLVVMISIWRLNVASNEKVIPRSLTWSFRWYWGICWGKVQVPCWFELLLI